MGRLKHDHSGWRSHGLWKKYQQPTVIEQPTKHKSKKNTRRWCKGKVGVEHALVRRFKHYGWSSRRSKVIYTVCTVCRKEFYKTKNEGVPLQIEIDETDERAFPIQVKVNGRAIPFNECTLKAMRTEHWVYCEYCKDWH